MPFKSEAQRRWMHANKPGMAERWEAETPSDAALPEHVPGRVKKAAMGESLSAGFPNAAGPEDWDAVGDSPWKQGEPKAKPDEKKEKESENYPFDGDGTKLMPYLRSIHKMGHVKQAVDESAQEIHIELPPQGNFKSGWREAGEGLKYWRPTVRERLRILREQLRGPGLDQFGRRQPTSEWAGKLTRNVAGPAAKALGAAGALYGTYRLGKHIGSKKNKEKTAAGIIDPGAVIENEAQQFSDTLPPADIGRRGLSPAELKALFVRMPRHHLDEINEELLEEALMQKALGKIGHVVPLQKKAEIYAWPEDMTQAQWNEMLDRHPDQEARWVRQRRAAGVGTLTGALGAAAGAASLGGLAARRNPWLAIPAGIGGALGGAAVGGGLGYGATYALPSPKAERVRREAAQEAEAARLVDPSRFRKEAQGEFEYADMGPSVYDGPHVTWKMPGKVKRSAGLDQEYPQVEDGEKGYDAPVTLQKPPGRTKTASLAALGPATCRALLDELWTLGQYTDYILEGRR